MEEREENMPELALSSEGTPLISRPMPPPAEPAPLPLEPIPPPWIITGG
jgi:hypothetical protein